MDAKQLIEAMKTQRQRWVDVAPGKRVRILLPTELEVVRHFAKVGAEGKLSLAADFDEVKRFTTGWEGFTEADILGAAVAPADPAAFDPDLWELVAAEHLDWVRSVAQALLQGIVDRQLAREADAKN